MSQKKSMNLGVKILIGLVLGIVVGAIFWATMGAEAAGAFTAKYIKPFGDIFVNLLKFIVVPLVLLSIMDGVIQMGDIKKVGKIGWKTVAYFLVTTAIACVIGLGWKTVAYFLVTTAIACVIGLIIASAFKGSFPMLQLAEGAEYEAKSANLMDTIVNIFPSNAINPLSTAAMLQIIFIALIFGCGVLVAGEKGKPFGDFITSFNEVTQRVMSFILAVSPYGVFALMVWVVAAQGRLARSRPAGRLHRLHYPRPAGLHAVRQGLCQDVPAVLLQEDLPGRRVCLYLHLLCRHAPDHQGVLR